MTDGEWDEFVAGMGAETGVSQQDTLVWRVTKDKREITCHVREVRNGGDVVGIELRVSHDGEMHLTETHRQRAVFQQRVNELREMLKAQGWMKG